MQAPSIVIVTDASRLAMNDIWEAMGRGPGTFSRKLCAINPAATSETPATHWLMQDMGATQDDVVEWAAMAEDNDLPSLPSGTVWGEGGVISAADAQAAIANGNMFVFPAYGLDGEVSQLAWRDGELVGMGLQFVPDPEI